MIAADQYPIAVVLGLTVAASHYPTAIAIEFHCPTVVVVGYRSIAADQYLTVVVRCQIVAASHHPIAIAIGSHWRCPNPIVDHLELEGMC